MKRDKLQAANLTDLRRRYREAKPTVSQAAAFLTEHREKPKLLRRVLRDYKERPIISPTEIRRRDGVDDLLGYYGLLELACLVQFVPTPLPRTVTAEIKRCLGQESVQAYYEQFYVLVLPQSLYQRVTGKHNLSERHITTGIAAYLEFLSFVNEFEGDKEIEALLEFMDDYVTDGVSWVDVHDVLVDPKLYVRAIATKPSDQTRLHAAVHGFRKFLEFAENFERFLRVLDDVPLFRSGAWHYFSYWFEHIDDRIGPVLDKILLNILKAAGKEAGVTERNAIKAAAQRQHEQLRRLVDSPYRGDLPIPVGIPNYLSTEGGRKKGGRGKFAMTGDESVYQFIKANGPVTAAEVNKHWQAEGRGGKADNALTKLTATGQVKREKIKGAQGSNYSAK